jgi:hypothetical protein
VVKTQGVVAKNIAAWLKKTQDNILPRLVIKVVSFIDAQGKALYHAIKDYSNLYCIGLFFLILIR